jgi:hypothetical protein
MLLPASPTKPDVRLSCIRHSSQHICQKMNSFGIHTKGRLIAKVSNLSVDHR